MRVIGVEVPIVTKPERVRPEKSEVSELLSDNRKARAAFGWQQRISLEDGLAETVAFFRKHPSGSGRPSYAL